MTSSSSYRRFFGEEWTPVSTRMPEGGIYGLAYASLDEARHFVFGADDPNGRFSNVVVEYDSTSQNFATHTPLPEGRGLSAATAIDEHRLLVVGGYTGTVVGSCRMYDTRTKKWFTDWPDLNHARYLHTCVCTNNNKVYAIGGRNDQWRDGHALDTVEELDLSRGTPQWRILPQRLKKARAGCSAVVDPTNPNNIIVVGGECEGYCEDSCEIVSLEQAQEGQTTTIPSLPTPRGHHTLVLVENRFVVAMGGYNDRGQTVSAVEVLDLGEDPLQRQWRPLPSIKTARYQFAAFYSARKNNIVVVGGRDDDDNCLDMVEELQFCFKELRKPPPLRKLPPGFMDSTHRTELQRWLSETEGQMRGFIQNINGREEALIQERDENRRIRNDYIVHVNEMLSQARSILSLQEPGNPTKTLSSAGNAVVSPHEDVRNPPPLTKIPAGFMDATHRRDIELWIEETSQNKVAYIAAVDTQENTLVREVNENRRVCDEYVARVRTLQNQARGIIGFIDNPRSAVNAEPGPSNIPADIPPQINVDRAFNYDEQQSFDGGARSIPSRPDGASVSTRGPFVFNGQGSLDGAARSIPSRADDVSEMTSTTMQSIKKKKKGWFRRRR